MTAIEEELRRVGLEPIDGKYPRIVHEGDQIFLKAWDEGSRRDVVCEVGIRRAFILLIELALALARIVPR